MLNPIFYLSHALEEQKGVRKMRKLGHKKD